MWTSAYILCITAEVLDTIAALEQDHLRNKATSWKSLFVFVPIYL